MVACISAQSSHGEVTLCRRIGSDPDSYLNESGLTHEGRFTPRDVVHTTAIIHIINYLKDLGSSRDFDVQGTCTPASIASSFDSELEGKVLARNGCHAKKGL